MSKYFVGTAGWSYKDWEGIVYPSDKPTGFHPLVFLSGYINIIEINSTYYRTPPVSMSISWIKRINDRPDFLFTVKLHQIFTHQRKDFTQKEVDEFKKGVAPLHIEGRLAAILIQFPWSFTGTPVHYDYLIRLFKLFSEFPLALEVRHSSWDETRFYTLLTENKVAFCNIDQPIFRNSIKPSSTSTNTDFAYVRLHGRNYENWFKKNAGRDARYDYLYQKEELDEWIKRIKGLGQKSKKVFTITNNHYSGQALANAFQIKHMISGEKLDIPLSLLKQYPILKDMLKEKKTGQLGLFHINEE